MIMPMAATTLPMTMTRMRLRSAGDVEGDQVKDSQTGKRPGHEAKDAEEDAWGEAAEDEDEQNDGHLHVDALDKGEPGAGTLKATDQDGEGTQDGAE